MIIMIIMTKPLVCVHCYHYYYHYYYYHYYYYYVHSGPRRLRQPGPARPGPGRCCCPRTRVAEAQPFPPLSHLPKRPRRAARSHALEGTKGGPKEWGSRVTTGSIVSYSQFVTSSNPHEDRCANPLPWDHLSSPQSEDGAPRGCFGRAAAAPVLCGLSGLECAVAMSRNGMEQNLCVLMTIMLCVFCDIVRVLFSVSFIVSAGA